MSRRSLSRAALRPPSVTPSAPLTSQPRSRRWRGNEEPRLEDLLADPVLHLLLRRDRLSLADVEDAVAGARTRLRARAGRLRIRLAWSDEHGFVPTPTERSGG